VKGVRVEDVSAGHVSDVKNYFGWNCRSKARGGGGVVTRSGQPGRHTVSWCRNVCQRFVRIWFVPTDDIPGISS